MAPKILVVDDDAPTRSLLHALLEHSGKTCVPAGDGRQALDLLRAGEYDVIVLDLLLPDMDGFEVLRQMKESGTPLLARTIVLTAAAERIYEKKEELDGIWCVLKKPVDIGELSEEIEDCAAQRRRERKPAARVDPPAPQSREKTG